MIHTGIGARATPPHALILMRNLGRVLAELGWTLRSGGAPGADTAFEIGCDLGRGAKEIFLPHAGFNRSRAPFRGIPDRAFEIAASLHENWAACKPFDRCAHGRNVQEVLGQELDTPADLVIAWTEGGLLKGGTRTALRLAGRMGIPVLNLGSPPFTRLDFPQILARVLHANAQAPEPQ